MTTPTAPHPVLRQYYAQDHDRAPFVTALFDGSATHYDRVCGLMSLGSGRWYRQNALVRAGLRPGMRVLDVATGTGLVARAAAGILRDPRAVVGLDPSAGMLREAQRTITAPLVQGQIEHLPFAAERFDFVTIGYALRHVTDLELAFHACRRVLKPGGRLLLLEISLPRSAASRSLIRLYFMRVLPVIMGFRTRNPHARTLTRYYWDTIASCVPPETILEVLRHAGFAGVERRVFAGVVSEYLATRPPGTSPDRQSLRLDAAQRVTAQEAQ
jgi:demethylmenaquinone methyltransferase/2-methoxy-6-polyprenyl-1,4-benzoquinol methylase